MNKEPRYYLLKDHVLDTWEDKKIDCKDMLPGHDCSYVIPARFISEERKRMWREPMNVQGVLVTDDD